MRSIHRYHLPLDPHDALVLHRDHVPDFAPRLPGVARVDRVEHERLADGRERVVHAWQGDLSMVPGPLRAAIDGPAFRWSDHTTWDVEQGTCTWELEVPVLSSAPLIQGRYRFLQSPSGTEVEVDADLRLVPGPDSPFVRSFLGRSLFPVVERFVAALFERIMGSSTAVIRDFADERPRIAA